MPRPARPWFRLYVETFSDRKLRRLTPTQRWIWVSILGAARESPEPGRLLVASDEPMTQLELADYADVRPREVGPAVTQMRRLGMLNLDGDVMEVSNWGARQYESDDVTKRTRDHRERSKERSNAVPSNVRRNAPETETETEHPSGVGAPRRGQRINEDWKPTEADVAWARSEGYDDLTQRRETEKFVDHFVAASGQNAKKLDWSRAWKNWLRNAKGTAQPHRRTGTDEGMPW